MTDQNGLYFETHGQSDKPAVLFLHGFMGSTRDWEVVVEKLKHKSINILTIDLPGHGKTRINTDEKSYSIPETANRIIQVLDHLDIQKCSIVGYSMGGRLALYLVLTYPERFTHLVMESAGPGIIDLFERENRQRHDEIVAEKMQADDFESFVLKWYYQPIFRSLILHPNFQNLLYLRLGNDPAELAKVLRNMGQGTQEPMWYKLTNITIPVLLMAGDKDTKYTEIVQDMARFNPGFKTKIFKDCGHNLHFEVPDKFTRLILDFLK
ncbi:2-succinyl-6-hydroxy-2,4-cyclohexadiene-1-carboxylate synthase [candidate division KSB1 bacterium]|nr:2-succinyl-6-hydroxy-2,4-cyclohexadiene-1-carboxylate synthase [candidate division KSB1 bacterium]